MKNQEISQIIDNLRGRKGYEEKKAKKLGYTSLYDYFEDKLEKKTNSYWEWKRTSETSCYSKRYFERKQIITE